MLLRNGKLLQWSRHYAKLFKDCLTLNFPCPAEALLQQELEFLTRNTRDGIVKILVTRGRSQRGYAPALHPTATRILSLNPLPAYPEIYSKSGVRLHLCQLRLAHQPRLAGAKHLNRLENILAAAEWNDPEIAEGLLLDESGNVIEGVRSNLFMVKDAELITPDLSQCGVAGVTRERLIERAATQGMPCRITNVSLPDLLQADEIFLVNTVIGVWPVREMPGYFCEHFPVAHDIQDWLLNENN
jgi:4-amino-4-deoxychorismate lyase